MTTSGREIINRVIDYTLSHPDERDQWEKAPAISGILAWNDEGSVAQARHWIDRAVATQTTAGVLNYNERIELPAGHVHTFTPTAALSASIGHPMLVYYQRTGEKRYLEAAKLHVDALMKAPRTRDGGISCRWETPELWIDFTYLMCPFLGLYGKVAGEQAHVDEAFRQFEVHADHLVCKSKHLARHAWCETPDHYPQSTFWARGNGWLFNCANDLIDIDSGNARADEVAGIGRRALEAMRVHQDRSGFFHHILDDHHSKLEASATAMFAYGVGEAMRHGIIGDEMLEDALRAYRAVEGTVMEDGAVPGVAVPPGGPGVPFGTTLFGQGFFLLAGYSLRKYLEI
jgi:unsaturated rhamnogalacturonyl hydrolase